ncbi:ap2 domain transcription factor ap2iv-1 [Cystoisospora suis]|uniref:Ap2 domain transcription factor ap2iv-1 n=1 Tax=Cystoisospora suis TaxID=483139 RepID=A0A2C6KPG3_9APIC|nr:ap2 domain transcription factor ap2iv-1 [Cystoisospora suis]
MLPQARCFCVLGTVVSHGQGEAIQSPLGACKSRLQQNSFLQGRNGFTGRKREILLPGRSSCCLSASALTHRRSLALAARSSSLVFSPSAPSLPACGCKTTPSADRPKCFSHNSFSSLFSFRQQRRRHSKAQARDGLSSLVATETVHCQAPLMPLLPAEHFTYGFCTWPAQRRSGYCSYAPDPLSSGHCMCTRNSSASLRTFRRPRAGWFRLAEEEGDTLKSCADPSEQRCTLDDLPPVFPPTNSPTICHRPFAVFSYHGIRGETSGHSASALFPISRERTGFLVVDVQSCIPFSRNFGTQRVVQKRRHQMRILHPAQTPYIPHEERRPPIPHSLTASSTVKRLLNNNTIAAKEAAKRINWDAYVCTQRGVRWHPQGAWRVQFSRKNHERNFFVRCECYFRVSNYGFETAKELAIRYRKRLEKEWEELQEQWMKLDILEAQKRHDATQNPEMVERLPNKGSQIEAE